MTQEEAVADQIIGILSELVEGAACDIEEETSLDILPSEEVETDEIDATFEDEVIGHGRQMESFSYEYAKGVLEWREMKKNERADKQYPPFKTIQFRFRRVKAPIYRAHFKTYVEKMGTNHEKFCLILQGMYCQFLNAQADGLPVHNRELKLWALQKAADLKMITESFKASHSWIQNFKKKNKITSQKITKFVTLHGVAKVADVQVAAFEFQMCMHDEIMSHFKMDEIFNFDQCGINYKMHSARILLFRGEKNTEMLA